MIIMSVDLGLARTGIALCTADESMAYPHSVIKEYSHTKLIEKISDLAKECDAGLIVVGYPKNMDGTLGERAETCAGVARAIEEKSGIKTELWDERCTTTQAHILLNMNDKRGKKRKEIVDAVAAVIILEAYIAARKNKKK